LAEKIAKSKPAGKKHLVFAPAKYVPNSKLLPMGVEYAPLPFALYRIERG
jgi:adenine-specific DNA-methyltransferase